MLPPPFLARSEVVGVVARQPLARVEPVAPSAPTTAIMHHGLLAAHGKRVHIATRPLA